MKSPHGVRNRLFRSLDHFTLEAFKAARAMDRQEGRDLAREIRRLCSASVLANQVTPIT